MMAYGTAGRHRACQHVGRSCGRGDGVDAPRWLPKRQPEQNVTQQVVHSLSRGFRCPAAGLDTPREDGPATSSSAPDVGCASNRAQLSVCGLTGHGPGVAATAVEASARGCGSPRDEQRWCWRLAV